VFAWDGVGLGEDGTLWGGEAFAVRPALAARRSMRRSAARRATRRP